MCSGSDKFRFITSKRPELKPLFYNDQSIQEYVSIMCKKRGFYTDIRHEVEKYCYDKINVLYNEKIASEVVNTLRENDLFSSADHHSLLTFPLLINTNILYLMVVMESGRRNQIVFSCSGIPLNNIAFPRGFYFRNSKIPLVSCNKKRASVYAMPNVNIGDAVYKFNKYVKEEEDLEFLKTLFAECLGKGTENIATINYCDQISVFNSVMWPLFFRRTTINVPALIYISVEDIFAHIFRNEKIIKNEVIWEILFNKEVRDDCVNLFDGVSGAWSNREYGTHLFWGIESRCQSYPLYLNGNYLEGKYGSYKLEYNTLCDLLIHKKIYPSLFLAYLLLMFIGGYVLAGGFNQISYLSIMKERLNELCEKHNYLEAKKKINELPVDNLICGLKLIDIGGVDAIKDGLLTDNKLCMLRKCAVSKCMTDNISFIHELVSG